MSDDNSEKNESFNLSELGSFDFTPAWAKGRADDKTKYSRFEASEERKEARRPFGERKPFGDRTPRRDDRTPRCDDRAGWRDDRAGRRDERRPRRDDARVFIKPLDVDVRILPSQKELGPIIRQLQTKHTAYALKQLAYLFLDNPAACVLRITQKKDAAEPIVFHQCKACGFTVLDAEELVQHIQSEHLLDYYDAETVDCEPPKGAFNCVAKCGVTGVLLGPPNLHGYDAKVREMLRTQCPGMPESEYRARIEMVRDSEAVEAWRASATKKTIYRRKGEETAVDREAAEMEFRRTILPGLTSTAKAIDLSAQVALKSPCRALVFACRDAIARERRFPASLFFALRGAFHHRKLEFFRANDPRGPEFVVAQKLSPLDVEHAIAELAELVKFVEAHPCITQGETVAQLAGDDATKAEELRKTLAWLIEKGHLVGYFNGVLAVPADHPKYHPPRPPRKEAPVAAAEPSAEAPAEAAPVEPAPSVETPAEADAPAPEAEQ